MNVATASSPQAVGQNPQFHSTENPAEVNALAAVVGENLGVETQSARDRRRVRVEKKFIERLESHLKEISDLD